MNTEPLTAAQIDFVWEHIVDCCHTLIPEYVHSSQLNRQDRLELIKHLVFLPSIKHVQNVDHPDEEVVAFTLSADINNAWDTFMYLADKYTEMFNDVTDEYILTFKTNVFVYACKVALYPNEFFHSQEHLAHDDCFEVASFLA